MKIQRLAGSMTCAILAVNRSDREVFERLTASKGVLDPTWLAPASCPSYFGVFRMTIFRCRGSLRFPSLSLADQLIQRETALLRFRLCRFQRILLVSSGQIRERLIHILSKLDEFVFGHFGEVDLLCHRSASFLGLLIPPAQTRNFSDTPQDAGCKKRE